MHIIQVMVIIVYMAFRYPYDTLPVLNTYTIDMSHLILIIAIVINVV
jgi:hypothetical protein